MQVCHSGSAVFDDPNLVSCAGLVPVVSLAERAGLHQLIGEHVRVPGTAGSNPVTKVVALIAGMIAGADNINKMDLLRLQVWLHRASGRVDGVAWSAHDLQMCGTGRFRCANLLRHGPGPCCGVTDAGSARAGALRPPVAAPLREDLIHERLALRGPAVRT